MVLHSIDSKCLAVALIAAHGVIAIDESIEHGYTIPLIADWYWDLEGQIIDESLGPYDGNWKGFAVPTNETVEDSKGETISCGGGYVQLRVYGSKISGTFFDSNGYGYQLSATLFDDGSVSDGTATGFENGGTWQATFEESIVTGDWQDNYGCFGTWSAYPVSYMSQDVDEIHNSTTSENNTNQSDGNQDNQTNETGEQANQTNETGEQANGNETAVTNSPESDDEDTSFLESPIIKPFAKAVMGEPYESEPDPDGETKETITQVGIISGLGVTGHAVKRNKIKKLKQVEPKSKTKSKSGFVSKLKDAGKALLGKIGIGTAGLDTVVDMKETLDTGVEVAKEKQETWSKPGDPEPKTFEEQVKQDDADYQTFQNRGEELKEMGKRAAGTYPSLIGAGVGTALGGLLGGPPGAAFGMMVGGSIGSYFT